MTPRFVKYLVFIMLLKFSILPAQQYYFKNYTAENGLPFVQVACMFQDSKGYLWTGGYGGLSRFDGKTFLNFSPKNGLINHNVNAICEGDSGIIYVATDKGLSAINNRSIANYGAKEGLPAIRLNALAFIKDHGLFLGSKKGLFNLKAKKISILNDFKDKEIKCLLVFSKNILCVGTSNGLLFYNLETKVTTRQLGLDDERINCLAKCSETGRLLVGTINGFSIIESLEKKPSNFHIQNGLIDENITSVLCENRSSIWIGSANGLLKFNGNEFSFYNLYNDNNANNILCIIKDFENNIWIGTHNSGLYKYRDNAFSSFSKQEAIGNTLIFQIFRDKKGDLWFCTETGVFKYSQGFFKHYTTKDGLADNYCDAAMEDDDGTIWFCTNKGISKLKNNTFQNFTSAQGFQIKGPLSVIYKDSKKTIWVGGQTGLAAFKKTNGAYIASYYTLKNIDNEYGVSAFVEDKNGGLWAGTSYNGLYKFENDHFEAQSKISNVVTPESYFTLLCDKNNVIYGATLNGLWVYNVNTGKQNFISENEGLNSELLYSLRLSENENALWIGTNQGINKLNLKKYLASNIIEITSYGKADGFTGVECNSYGIWEDVDSTFWFGTVSGVVKHEPKSIKKNEELTKTYIQSIKVLNEDTVLKNGSILPYNYNNIAFYYRGICFTNPDKVLYIKKLNGFESKWSEPSTEDYTKYASLPPGTYTFQVKSCNNEGIWEIEPAEFSFEIKTPYFKTWWFTFSIVAFIFLILFSIFQIRVRNIRKKEKAEFETQVEISKVELKALRAQMNPHFVFNSLNSIQHYILNSNINEAAKYLNKFAKLIRIILNNSEKAMVTVNEDVESLTLYLELEQMRFDGKFDYSVNIDESIDADYDEIPPMLMQPYLENAILHGLNPKIEKGHLKIDIFTKNNYIVCRITDDGIGRDSAGEIKRTQPGQQHKSLGMKITSERVRILNAIHNSTLSVSVTDLKDEHQKAVGTMVEIYIPHLK